MVANSAIISVGDLLTAALSGLNIPVKFRPGPSYTITLPHVVYDVTTISSPGCDNKKFLHNYTFNVIYETANAEDEGFLRLLDMPETRFVGSVQLPGYNRYTFKINHFQGGNNYD